MPELKGRGVPKEGTAGGIGTAYVTEPRPVRSRFGRRGAKPLNLIRNRPGTLLTDPIEVRDRFGFRDPGSVASEKALPFLVLRGSEVSTR